MRCGAVARPVFPLRSVADRTVRPPRFRAAVLIPIGDGRDGLMERNLGAAGRADAYQTAFPGGLAAGRLQTADCDPFSSHEASTTTTGRGACAIA
jgi:hypothetical protein